MRKNNTTFRSLTGTISNTTNPPSTDNWDVPKSDKQVIARTLILKTAIYM